MQAPEENRGRQDQLAARDMKFAGGGPLCLVDLVEDAPGRRNVGGTGVGQGDFASRADQESGPEMLLKLVHLAAHGCQRHPQIAAGSRKAPSVRHPEEDRHGFEAIHDYSIYRERYSQS